MQRSPVRRNAGERSLLRKLVHRLNGVGEYENMGYDNIHPDKEMKMQKKTTTTMNPLRGTRRQVGRVCVAEFARKPEKENQDAWESDRRNCEILNSGSTVARQVIVNRIPVSRIL